MIQFILLEWKIHVEDEFQTWTVNKSFSLSDPAVKDEFWFYSIQMSENSLDYWQSFWARYQELFLSYMNDVDVSHTESSDPTRKSLITWVRTIYHQFVIWLCRVYSEYSWRAQFFNSSISDSFCTKNHSDTNLFGVHQRLNVQSMRLAAGKHLSNMSFPTTVCTFRLSTTPLLFIRLTPKSV